METLTFVLLAIVIAVDARKVCVPVPDSDPCASLRAAAMPIWQEAAQMLKNLNTECSNVLNSLSFANEMEFDAFNAEFYTTGHCMTTHLSASEGLINSIASIAGIYHDVYYGLVYGFSEREGDALCLAEGDASIINAFSDVLNGWVNIIQSKRPT
ncbi:CLUMA_CG015824, isoform A [Clunio marinus]|uniref:CLUMA_CG015824, isoform A n=1 Tax=Clunio marinus TaxID=568069 RepID=A0A1J1IRV1_9DIPT|nr:CLUMA_CG015824, isoform A [Clunio marinus]